MQKAELFYDRDGIVNFWKPKNIVNFAKSKRLNRKINKLKNRY